jgi:MFS family permease
MPHDSTSPTFSQRGLAEALGLKRNLVLLLVAIVLIGSGEEMWMRFVPKYLQGLGAGIFIIGLFDALKTFLGAVYAWPGGVLSDHWGHRRALVLFNVLSVAGYALVALMPHWSAVLVGMFFFLAWSSLS